LRRLALGLICVLVVGWTSLGGWDSWIGAHRIAAGPENETALYQNYDPERVIKNFRYEGESYGGGYGYGAVPLIKSIRQNKDFTPRFTMRSDRELDLMNALHQDILLWLRVTGANLVATHDEADGGFTYRYISGKSVGSISVQAPFHHTTERRYPVPSGLDDVVLKIALEETWTRPESETGWWMSMVD
jgi:hypothetical protein